MFKIPYPTARGDIIKIIAEFEGKKFNLAVSFTEDGYSKVRAFQYTKCLSAFPEFNLTPSGDGLTATVSTFAVGNQGYTNGIDVSPFDISDKPTYEGFQKLIASLPTL
jgi:hypothetical protein